MAEPDDGTSAQRFLDPIPAAPPEEPKELADLVCNTVPLADSTEDINLDTENKTIDDSMIVDESILEELKKIFDPVADDQSSNVLPTICGDKEDAKIPFTMKNASPHSIESEDFKEDVHRSPNEDIDSHVSMPLCEVESRLEEEFGMEKNYPVTNEDSLMDTRRTPSPFVSSDESPMKEERPIKRLEKEDAVEIARVAKSVAPKEPKPSVMPQHLLKPADVDERSGAVAMRIPFLAVPTLDEVYSKVVTVMGVPWCLFFKVYQSTFSLFLKCLEGDEFMCEAHTITYKMHHPFDADRDMVKSAAHKFTAVESDWGYKIFANRDVLPKYVQNDDTILFSCQFSINHPQVARYLSDEENRVPVGLVNQGATCYMNVALQIIFSTKCLTKAILELDYSEDDVGVVKALQKLFYKMRTSAMPLTTEDLTNAFGWKNTNNLFTQHDVQEMMKMLMDKIETAFKGTRFEGMVDDLFKTKTRTFIRCLDVKFESGRDEHCWEMQLPVKRQNGSTAPYDIVDALREVTQTEVMNGVNKYAAEGHGLQRAEKGVKLVSLPKVLHLQLLRFQLDWDSGEYVKVHNRVEFSDKINLQEFIEAKDDDGTPHEYALHGVILHSGTMVRGHYTALVCNHPGSDKQKWFKFDDAVVTEVSKEYVISEDHFGRRDSSFNAYMLTYIRADLLSEVLTELPLSIVPERVIKEVEEEKKMDKWTSIAMESNIFRIRFVEEPDYMSTLVWDHFDYVKYLNDPYRLKLEGTAAAIKLFHEAQDWFEQSDVRLFVMERRKEKKGVVWRVKRELESELSEIQARTVKSILGEGSKEYVIFVMGSKPLSIKQTEKGRETEENESKRIMFIKWYDGKTHCTRYVAPLEVPLRVSLCDLSEKVSRAARLPLTSHIKFWKEIWFDELKAVSDLGSIGDGGCRMGDVIVFELVHLVRKEKTVQSILDDSRRLHVSFNPCKQKQCCGLIKEEDNRIVYSITVSMTCTYRKLLDQLSSLLDHSPEKMMIWENGQAVGTHQLDDTLSSAIIHELNSDPRLESKAVIEFARLSVTLEESECHIGIATSVRMDRIGHVFATEYMRRDQCEVSRFTDQLREKYHEMGDVDKLRFVWRFRQGSGYFVFREIRSSDDIMEIMEDNRFSLFPDSLMVCVDEMEDREMDEMRDDEIVIPLVFIKSRNVKWFTNEEPTVFIKIRENDNIRTIKTIIQDKCGEDLINWEAMDLLVYTGSRGVMIELQPPELNAVYEEFREVPGLSDSRETRMFLAIYIREVETVKTEKKVIRSQPIVIRD